MTNNWLVSFSRNPNCTDIFELCITTNEDSIDADDLVMKLYSTILNELVAYCLRKIEIILVWKLIFVNQSVAA